MFLVSVEVSGSKSKSKVERSPTLCLNTKINTARRLSQILRPNEEKVALFCHGNFARVWLSSLLKVPLHIMMASFDYDHTGVTVLHFRNNKDGITAPRCMMYSDISHLYAHGPDTNYNGFFKL